ncbi:MAG TPA: hypothetical protein VFZ59_03280 [Verrucomicrobiae bacterium]|nr:hypothetical protein [Verrucomicrobiae bacterium]
MSTESRNTNYPAESATAEVLRETLLVRDRTPDDDPSPEQIAIYRKMPGARRLKLAEQMFWFARDLKTSGVRHQHPDWTAEQVRTEVNRIFLHARE